MLQRTLEIHPLRSLAIEPGAASAIAGLPAARCAAAAKTATATAPASAATAAPTAAAHAAAPASGVKAAATPAPRAAHEAQNRRYQPHADCRNERAEHHPA